MNTEERCAMYESIDNHIKKELKIAYTDKETYIGRIVYNHIKLAGLFISFRDKKDNVVGTIRISVIDKYDKDKNEILLK